jgi:hypothetical protein
MSSLLDNLPHRCTARRRKRESDSMGGSVDTFTQVLFSSRECWRQAASDREVSYWQQRSIDITEMIYFNSDPDLQENDVLTFPDVSGWYYDVKSYAQPDSSVGLGILWRVTVQRIKGSVT